MKDYPKFAHGGRTILGGVVPVISPPAKVCTWIVRHRGVAVKFVRNVRGSVWDVASDDEATEFASESDARTESIRRGIKEFTVALKDNGLDQPQTPREKP